MDSPKRHFRTVFTARLVQLTALNIGGTLSSSDIDAPLATDGQGRFVIRGTSLAGALLASLRKLGYSVPECVSGTTNGDLQSRWLVHNLHLANAQPVHPEIRQMVALDPKTRGPKDGALFDVETLPRGTAWKLFIEADVRDDEEGREAEGLLATVLNHWAAEGGWLGAHAARGMGFCHVEELAATRIFTPPVSPDWPDTRIPDPWSHFRGMSVGASVDPATITPKTQPDPWQKAEIVAEIVVGPRSDGYGLDMLSIGGHESLVYESELDDAFLAPLGAKRADWTHRSDFDMFVAGSRYGSRPDKLYPYIPGSSLRGAIRHAIERMRPMKGEDPVVKELFGYVVSQNGSTEAADGQLIVRDAYLLSDCLGNGTQRYRMALIQQHAEDEFTAGVFGSSKFDRVAVVSGRFAINLTVERPPGSRMRPLQESLRQLLPMLQLAEQGQLDLGGAVFRGAGWPRWENIRFSVGPYGGKPERSGDLASLQNFLQEDVHGN